MKSWHQKSRYSVCVYIVQFLFLWFSWLSKCLKWCFLILLFISLTIYCHSTS